MPKIYQIKEARLLELLAAESELTVLEMTGVDNWSGYGEGEEEYFAECSEEYETPVTSHVEVAKEDIKNYEVIG